MQNLDLLLEAGGRLEVGENGFIILISALQEVVRGGEEPQKAITNGLK